MERRQPARVWGVRSGGTCQRNQGKALRYVPHLLELRCCPPPLPLSHLPLRSYRLDYL